jgi:PPOX class probable F420-dependent enzyme
MIGTPVQDAFINRNKWAVVTTLRRDGSPTNSVIFYARDGDALLFSTTAGRVKARTLRRDPRIALTALDEGAPFGFVTVEGTAEIVPTERFDEVVAGHVLLRRAMSGRDFEATDEYRAQLRRDGRVIVRVMPTRVSGVPERAR